MNWVRDNKFLASFFAVMFVGVAGLGFLLYTAHGTYSDVSDAYNEQVTQLLRLQSLQPYPDDQNLKKYQEQKDIFANGVAELRKSLAAQELPQPQLTAVQFQDALKQSAAQYANKAAAVGVKLPDGFYLGFESYRNTPPKPEAASPLGRQLRAIEVVLNRLLDAGRVSSVDAINRLPLPEEQGVATKAPVKKGLVSYYPFDLKFTCIQPAFRKFLNSVVSDKEQFFVVRSVRVANSSDKGPARVTALAGATPTPAPGTGEKARFQFILGTESVKVALRIDIVDFPVATPNS